MLSDLAEAERRVYLEQNAQDKGNGSYARSLQLGSMPIEMSVPRSRSGSFRPSLLPEPYQRGFAEETEELLIRLLSSSRSVNAAKQALVDLGLGRCEDKLERVAQSFIERCELREKSPLPADMLALFIDGKHIELKDGDRLIPACIYLVVGLDTDGKKRVLCCSVLPGRESAEGWKKVMTSLLERGLRRVMLVIQDDYPGLVALNKGLFPGADIQLCLVHMQRNARTHLPKDTASEFMQRIATIKSSWDKDKATAEFEALCDAFEKQAPHFIKALRKKKEHYLAFIDYPEQVRHAFSNTNAVEVVNKHLELMRQNNGGYFHSEKNLKLKLGITLENLENGRWKKPYSRVASCIHQLNAMFERKFSHE